MKRCLLLALLFCLTPPLSAQDGELARARAAFKIAVAQKDVSGARVAADTLVQADSKQAVDALLEGYGLCARLIKSLWGEKTKHQRDMEANADFEYDYQGSRGTVKPGDGGKRSRFLTAQKKAQEVMDELRKIDGVKLVIVAALARFSSDEAVGEMLKKLKGDSDWTRRAGVSEALGSIAHKAIVPALLEQLTADRESGVRVAILKALTVKKEESDAVIVTVGALARDPFWQVTSAVVDYLRPLSVEKGRKAVGSLIEGLKDRDGRMKHEINDVLVKLLGVNKHGDYATWKDWWTQNEKAVSGGTYTPPAAKPLGKVAKTTFYGIPIQSKRVIFVIDRSGSMMDPGKWEEPDDVATGSGKKTEDPIQKGGDTKMHIARWQLKKALAGMLDGAMINILFFSNGVADTTIFHPTKLVELSTKTRKAATAFIDRMTPNGGTNIFDPMEKALSFAAKAEKGHTLTKDGVDTIFLLTDGIPNLGQYTEPTAILEQILSLNKLSRVKINTIGIFSTAGANALQKDEKEKGTEFLKKMAKDSDGVFKAPPE